VPSMHKMKINSINITFPFKPYPAQILTCSKIIDCLKNKKTGIIESPTGTGKSIAILCAVLAWHATNRSTRIFICSRTHKQLDQLVAQLRATAYAPKVCVLASRRALCLNKQALKGDVNASCRDLVKKGECRYFMGKERLAKSIGDVHDIEELRQAGERCTGCPYYASRMLSEDAAITFMPYNYVVDPMVRRTMGIELKDSVVIVDEAHNIEDACRSAGSIELTNDTIDIMLKELVGVYRRVEEYREDLVVLNYFLRKMRGLSDVKMTRSSADSECACFKGDEIVQHLAHKEVVPELIARMRMNALFKKNEDLKDAFSLVFLQTMESLVSVLMLVFSGKARSYALIVKGAPSAPSLNFMLLDADVMFNAVVQHVHALVVLSGTLTPFSAVENELNHHFTYSLVAPAVAQHTFCATILRNARTGGDMLGTYAYAECLEYVDEVIDVIYGVSGCVQGGGTVVFLPSYHAVNKVVSRMRSRGTNAGGSTVGGVMGLSGVMGGRTEGRNTMSNINDKNINNVNNINNRNLNNLNNINDKNINNVNTRNLNNLNNRNSNNINDKRTNSIFSNKIQKNIKIQGNTLRTAFQNRSEIKNGNNCIDNVFIETNDKNFSKVFAQYKKHPNPILLAVYRGKASEGTDFKDKLARAVILVGMPCPNIKEIGVELMRNHRPGWYENQIFKAVNQAIGRCVRHRMDWGGVFLVDVRYRRDKDRLCGWCRDRMVYGEYFGDVVDDFREFVGRMKEMDRNRSSMEGGRKSLMSGGENGKEGCNENGKEDCRESGKEGCNENGKEGCRENGRGNNLENSKKNNLENNPVNNKENDGNNTIITKNAAIKEQTYLKNDNFIEREYKNRKNTCDEEGTVKKTRIDEQ
ncbi:Helicase of the DEAD superfamily, partial [Trachipleistophora hominis]